MTQCRGSLKAPASCAADGAGAFWGLPLLRALKSRAGRARARTVQTGRAPDAGSSRGPAGRLGPPDRTADERAPRWQRAAPCPTLSMPRVCCERSALSARSPASATRTWSSTGRRSPYRRTSWRRPARTSGEDRAAAGRARPGVSPEPLVPTHPTPGRRSPPLTPGHRPARCPCGRTPRRAPRGRPLSFGRPQAGPVPPGDPRPPPGADPRSRAAALAPSLLRRPPGPPSRGGPRTPSWAGPGPAPASRAGPRRGPARGALLKFAGRSPRDRAVGRTGAAKRAGRAPPAEKPNKHFLAGCAQRGRPVGSRPDPRGRSSCQTCLYSLPVGAPRKRRAVRYGHTLK